MSINPGGQSRARTKNQFMDQWTVNFEREIVPNLSFSATFIHKRTGNILVNTPINRTTGRPFDYERKTLSQQRTDNRWISTASSSRISNGDGTINGDDVQWIADNTDYEVNNLTALDGHKPERIYKDCNLKSTNVSRAARKCSCPFSTPCRVDRQPQTISRLEH